MGKTICRWSGLGIVSLLLMASGAQAQPLSETGAQRNLEYAKADGKPLLLDLYVPKEGKGPFPLVIWVHGGGWKSGSKETFRPAQGLLGKGFAVASINYRLSGEAIFPAQIDDCKASVRWLRTNAAKYNLDPRRFGAFGSSAGGHLVALLGTSGKGDDQVQAVCDFYGPTDLIAMAKTPGYERHASPQSPESQLIGGPVLENVEKCKAANPLTYIGKDTPPFLIVCGDKDPVVPEGQSQLLHEALQKAGIESTLKVIPGAKHGGPEFMSPEIQNLVAEFFRKHLQA